MTTRVVYMGTPEFAVPILRALNGVPDIEMVGVVTRLDKPAGRGRDLMPPVVKVAALALGLPVIQPGSFRRESAVEAVRALAPDLIIVAAFGQILPKAILDLPRFGCLNVHASLLPRYRGASPITAAILAGDAETGNTIMRMDEGLDTGEMLAQERLVIASDDTTETLTVRLAEQGATLLARTLPLWLDGAIMPIPQDGTLATSTRLIRKEDSVIDWSQPAEIIARQLRAYTPWPGTQTIWKGQPLKIAKAHALSSEEVSSLLDHGAPEPGTVFSWGKGANLSVAIASGEQTALVLDVIQLPGKRAAPAGDVVRGQPSLDGAHLPS